MSHCRADAAARRKETPEAGRRIWQSEGCDVRTREKIPRSACHRAESKAPGFLAPGRRCHVPSMRTSSPGEGGGPVQSAAAGKSSGPCQPPNSARLTCTSRAQRSLPAARGSVITRPSIAATSGPGLAMASARAALAFHPASAAKTQKAAAAIFAVDGAIKHVASSAPAAAAIAHGHASWPATIPAMPASSGARKGNRCLDSSAKCPHPGPGAAVTAGREI